MKIVIGFIFLCLVFCHIDISNAVDVIKDDKLSSIIKSKLIKNITLNQIYFKVNFIQKDKVDVIDNIHFLRFPGFGYQLYDLDLVINKSSLSYPKLGWILYEVNYPLNENNKRLSKWSGRNMSILTGNKRLLAVNSDYEIKFISDGNIFKSAIAKDFELDVLKPESYLPFLEMKLYSHEFDHINYLRKEKNSLVFMAEKEVCEGVVIKKEYTVDSTMPDSPLYVKYIPSELKYCPYESYIPTLQDLTEFKKKERYLLDALTRNIYLKYFSDHYSEILSEIGFDSTTQLVDNTDFDILPDYNEYLGGIKLQKEVVCWSSKTSVDAYYNSLFPYEVPIFEVENGHKIIIGKKTRKNKKIEFYSFYRDAKNILFERTNTNLDEVQNYRYDPMLTDKGDVTVEDSSFKLIEPYKEWIDDCPTQHKDFLSYFEDKLYHYLVALDVETNEIYFISGEDIFLSKAVHLYGHYGEKKLVGKNLRMIGTQDRLCYMDDRLYSFQVEKLNKTNILFEDTTKMVIETLGYKDKESIRIKATLNYNDPDMISIEY